MRWWSKWILSLRGFPQKRRNCIVRKSKFGIRNIKLMKWQLYSTKTQRLPGRFTPMNSFSRLFNGYSLFSVVQIHICHCDRCAAHFCSIYFEREMSWGKHHAHLEGNGFNDVYNTIHMHSNINNATPLTLSMSVQWLVLPFLLWTIYIYWCINFQFKCWCLISHQAHRTNSMVTNAHKWPSNP